MPALAELAPKYLDARRTIIRSLHEGGAHLLLGSDSPQIFNVPGFAAHRELAAMVNAGLTPYEALSTGTSAPAEFLKQKGRYGTITVGADADLVLIQANPLVDIANTHRIAGVMVRGRWLDREFLDQELRKIENRMSTE
jgi:imidazolonepropionase-like amidohydrolase